MIRSQVKLILAAALAAFVLLPAGAAGQEGKEAEPSTALAAALSAACRANQTDFENYLTVDNAASFRALPEDERTSILRRFSLNDQIGKPLLSSDDQNHTVLRCTSPQGTTEFRFGDVRTHENLAFVAVAVTDSEKTEFGLVRENGGWRLISLGLVLLDFPQLSKQWADSDLQAREDGALANLRGLSEAIQTYKRAFGKLPDSISQLGPAPKDQVSPDQASLVSDQLASGDDGGYRFRYRVVPGAQEDETAFELVAVPDDYGKTGRRSFFLDAVGKVHGADRHGEQATPDDPDVP